MPNTDITRSNGPTGHRPTDVFGAMRAEMDRVLERFEHGWPRWPGSLARTFGSTQTMVPELDVHDNGKQLTIEVDLPGIEEKDVSVTMVSGLLTIKGERKSERDKKGENYYMAERCYGAFERTLQLPETIDEDKLEAKFDKGVLKIVAQKRPEAVKAEKRIEIKKA